MIGNLRFSSSAILANRPIDGQVFPLPSEPDWRIERERYQAKASVESIRRRILNCSLASNYDVILLLDDPLPCPEHSSAHCESLEVQFCANTDVLRSIKILRSDES